ncbi:MAG: phosphodiester glycosidase family protein [Acidimicrobiales bacterium]
MVQTRPVYRPPAPPSSHRLAAHVYWRRRALVLLAGATVVYGAYLASTLAYALHNPSYGVSSQARAAEWGRQHGLGGVVTWLETEWYTHHPAKVGGTVSDRSFGSGPTQVKLPANVEHLAAPADIVSPVAHPLPGEGVWHVVGRRTASGAPTVYEAFVRPDPVHTSYIVGIAWMDPTLLKAELYSGSSIPGVGAPYRYSAPISASASRGLVAAFNAGFRMQDANGGYYIQGRTLIPLRAGAASVVIFKDGTMTVGKWGRDVTMNNQVASVRQNLDLIVDNSKAVAGLASQNTDKWGKTLGGTFNVWRSGLGVTADGALVYVGGPALSISDLANVMVRAGVKRGMELDINTDWVQYSVYHGPLGQAINGGNGTSLLGLMDGTASRYFASYWTRDFFTMSLRPSELTTSTTTTTAPSG